VGPWSTAKRLFQEFQRDNGMLLAAAVAFYLLLSLVPLLLVGISITASVLQYALGTGAEAERHVFEFLERFVPLERQILRAALDDVIAARGPVAGLGLAGLLLVALGGFSTLETAINMIWRAPPRHFLLNRLFALLMLVVTGALLLLSLSITAVVQWAGRLPALSWLADEWSVQIVGILLPVAISGLMFSAIYRYYPAAGAAGAPPCGPVSSPRSSGSSSRSHIPTTAPPSWTSARPTARWAASSGWCSGSTTPAPWCCSAPS